MAYAMNKQKEYKAPPEVQEIVDEVMNKDTDEPNKETNDKENKETNNKEKPPQLEIGSAL